MKQESEALEVCVCNRELGAVEVEGHCVCDRAGVDVWNARLGALPV